MTVANHLPHLPLMLAGIPRPIAELLREVGLPTAELPRVALTAGGAGRFVLYDSRSTRSAARARRARSQGLEPIDIARLGAGLTVTPLSLWGRGRSESLADQPAAARDFLDRLKAELEIRGGVWLRLSDFPFPYQSAVCLSVACESDEFTDGAATATRLPGWMTEWVGAHDHSGQPLFIRESASRPHRVEDLTSLVGNAARCSLMWQTTFGEFARWWTIRRQAELQVWRTDAGYEIHASGDNPSFPLSIEIWRGTHLATLPVQQPVLNLRDDGLVFLQSQNKSPAGLAVPGEHILPLAAPYHSPFEQMRVA